MCIRFFFFTALLFLFFFPFALPFNSVNLSVLCSPFAVSLCSYTHIYISTCTLAKQEH